MYENLVHRVKLVSRFPSQVSLIWFFPVKDIIKGFRIASIQNEMTVTENSTPSKYCCFKRPFKHQSIIIYWTTNYYWLEIIWSEIQPSHNRKPMICQRNATVVILRVIQFEAWRISWQYRVLTCITAVKHFDESGVPAFARSMVTIKLELVGLIFVVALNHLSSVVNIFCVLMPYVLYDDARRVWQLCSFDKIIIQVTIMVFVILMQKVLLVENNYVKTSRISGLIDKWSNSVNELWITIRSNRNEYAPIHRNRVWPRRLVYDLIEVECDGIVVPLMWRHHLV